MCLAVIEGSQCRWYLDQSKIKTIVNIFALDLANFNSEF